MNSDPSRAARTYSGPGNVKDRTTRRARRHVRGARRGWLDCRAVRLREALSERAVWAQLLVPPADLPRA